MIIAAAPKHKIGYSYKIGAADSISDIGYHFKIGAADLMSNIG